MLKLSLQKKIGFLLMLFFFWAVISPEFTFARWAAQEKTIKLQKKEMKSGTKEENRAAGSNQEKQDSDLKKSGNKPVFRVQAGEKEKKKKIPWLFIAGGVVAAGIIIALLLKKKREPGIDDWQYTGPVEPDFDVNSLGIEWVRIPAGEFMMGDNWNVGSNYEQPVHAVYLDEYYISKYEITFDQYEQFCLERGWPFPIDNGWGRGNRPVIFVNWYSAKTFCQWLAQKTGKNLHLPTEAQWEKAARGTDQRRYPWGNSDYDCSLTNWRDCGSLTQPVGSYPSGVSPYGVFDMTGNVAEWCQDYFDPNYYSSSPYRNPQGPATGTWVILRGGSHGPHLSNLRAAARPSNAPYREFSDVGIRIVWER